jgi:hypothetical protein
MRRVYGSALVAAAITLLPAVSFAQGAAQAGDASRTVAGGGIAAGWQGKVDPKEATAGATIQQVKLSKEGDAIHVITGPASGFWQASNTAAGNYTIKATFKEPAFMGLNDHSHPYGLFIGGNDMGTDAQSYLYCAVNGNGSFIARGFGPAPFQLNGGRGAPAPSINKAAAKGDPVTNEVAINVLADKVECAINGAVVGTYDKATIVGAGKLKSTDGVYGIRFAHNTEGFVTGFSMTKK